MRSSRLFRPLASRQPRFLCPLGPKGDRFMSATDKTTFSSKTSISGCTSDEDLYAYRSQRWMWNESEQLRRRYVKFDIQGLIAVAEEAGGENAICIQVTKMVEGNFNKAFMAAMSDGSQLIVKIPNPNAGRKHYTTASEVATMRYLRTKLGIPVPKVIAYCPNARESKLGAEYIVLEKAPGIELARVWDDLEPRQKSAIVNKVAGITGKMSTAIFPYYGSLYYKRDLREAECLTIDGEFAIGPTTARRWFDDRRDEVVVNRGPWASPHELIDALTQREIACLNTFTSFSQDCQQGIFNGPGGYRPTREAKLAVLRDFQKILPHIVPQSDSLNAGIIWHSDLHSDNIFVDADDPTQITSVIDWQATPIYPMFLTASHPSLINFDGPHLQRFTKPRLPDNIKELSPTDKQAAKDLFLAQSLWLLYEIHVEKQTPQLMQAFRAADTLQCQLLGAVGSVFDDGEPYVQSMITDVVTDQKAWGKIVGTNESGRASVSCPLQYTEQDVQRQKNEFAVWRRDVERKQQVIDEIGAYTGWDGAVLRDGYDEMKRRLEEAKANFLDREGTTDAEREAWGSVWPFRDEIER